MASLERPTCGSNHRCATVSRELASVDSLVLSGVSKGIVLGPLMFLLYVNDIGAKVSPQTSIKFFADDCLLYRTIKSVVGERGLPQDYLDTMIEC